MVASTLEGNEQSKKLKGKYTVTFMPEDHVAICRYAPEHGNAAAVKKFKATHDVGERTVRSFKKKYMYLDKISKKQIAGTEAQQVTSFHDILSMN